MSRGLRTEFEFVIGIPVDVYKREEHEPIMEKIELALAEHASGYDRTTSRGGWIAQVNNPERKLEKTHNEKFKVMCMPERAAELSAAIKKSVSEILLSNPIQGVGAIHMAQYDGVEAHHFDICPGMDRT